MGGLTVAIHTPRRGPCGLLRGSPCYRRGRWFFAEEGGYSLIELLIAMVMVILGATFDVIFVAFRDQTASGNRAAATQLSSAIVERMTREVRQASQATIQNGAGAASSPGGRLDLETPVRPAGGTPRCSSQS